MASTWWTKAAFGFAAALIGNTVIGVSQAMQKYAVNRLRAQAVERPRWHDPLWVTGLSVNILGEICGNFVALSYASASVVAPLGAVSLVVNGILAGTVLGEQINRRNQLGYVYLILGVLVMVVIAPHSSDALTVDELADHVVAPTFLAYLAVLLAVGAYLSARFWRRQLRDPESYVVLAAILGAFTVVSSKILSVLLRLTFVDGQGQFASVVPYISMAVLASAAVFLEIVKQTAITLFDASCFWPLFFAGYNLVGITFSLTLSQELNGHIVGYGAGFAVGLALMWQGASRIGGTSLDAGAKGTVVSAADSDDLHRSAPVPVGGAGIPALARWALPQTFNIGRWLAQQWQQWRDRAGAGAGPHGAHKVAEP